MKLLHIVLASTLLLSCKSKKAVETDPTLPKDISEKTENNFTQQQDSEDLTQIRAEIDSLIENTVCTNPSEWRISPIGAKACGGPASYLAYPIENEEEVLPLIQRYTELNSAFNKKYNIMSDCMLVTPPSGIDCSDGKAILKYDSGI